MPSSVETSDVTTVHPESGRRFFYGWVMLPVAMLGLIATSPGQTYGVMVFTEPMRVALGLSHGEITAAYMLGSLLAALPITFVGMLMDRFGLRAVTSGCLILFGGACWVASMASGWFSLLLAFFLLRFLGPGAISLLSGNTLAFWFHRRLGTVEGIRQLGTACAMAVIPAGYLWLTNQLGWRMAYATLGVMVWTIVLPTAFCLIRNRPEDVGQRIDGGGEPETELVLEDRLPNDVSLTLNQTTRTIAFWLILMGTCLFGMIQTGLFFSLVSIVQSRGFQEADAVMLISAFALSLAGSHLFGGMLSDRIQGAVLMSLSLCGFSAGLGLFCMSDSSSGLLAAGSLLGASQGAFFGCSNPAWARYFGRDYLGRIRGFVMTFMIASSSLGPFLVGLCRDMTGDYELILSSFVLAPLPLAGLMLFARPPVASACENSSLEGSTACATT